MVERIKQVMEYEGMTPAHFADYIDIGRAVMSHILNGRNKPSLEVMTKILSKIDYIDSTWLLTGQGTMLKQATLMHQPEASGQIRQNPEQPLQRDLFSDSQAHEAAGSMPIAQPTSEYRKEIEVKAPHNIIQNTEKQGLNPSTVVEKKITKIIIYYSDNTFETFNPEIFETRKKS